MCPDTSTVDAAVKELFSHFKCRDLGTTEFLLGVGINRDCSKRSIGLYQCQFILDMLERYGMSDCQPVLTPMPPNTILTKDMGTFIAEADMAYVVVLLAHFSSNPGPKH